MSKIKLGLVAIVVVATVTTVFELRATRALNGELARLRVTEEEIERLQRENRRLASELARTGDPVSLPRELPSPPPSPAPSQAHPPSGVEAEIKPVMNAGRATPDAAMQTFCWAFNARDLAALAEFIVFSDDTQENRDAFLARFGESFRARYGTPEKYCASLLLSLHERLPSEAVKPDDPVVSLRVLNVRHLSTPNQAEVLLWFRTAAGFEGEAKDRMQLTDQGWTIASFSLAVQSPVHFATPRVETVTGGRKKK